MVDVERLLSEWLRSLDSVTELVGDRIYTEMPATKNFPLVVLTLITDVPVFSQPLRLTGSRVQIDCYGGPKVVARRISDVIRGEIDANLSGPHDGAVVTGVDVGAASPQPDQDFNPPKPRYRGDVTIWAHPADQLGS